MKPKQKTTEEVYDEKFDQKDYQKTIYSFSQSELALLTPWDMQIQLGQVASGVLNGLLHKKVLPRVGAKLVADTEICYDILENKLCMYQPRILCSLCNTKKAAFSSANKFYCEGCADILRRQAAEKKPQEEKPAEKKPVKAKS